MTQPLTRLHVYERGGHSPRGFRAAASLHCHTHHSKEILTFIPHYAAMIPVISRLFSCDDASGQEEVARRIVESFPDYRIIFRRDLPRLFAEGYSGFIVFLDVEAPWYTVSE